MIGAKLGHLITLMRNERRSLDELLARQFAKLQALVDHAYRHVPFYREKYHQAGFQPGDIKSIKDLQRLPIISKADFHAQTSRTYIDRRISTPEALVPMRTSGSSGQTLEFFIDHNYDQFRKAQFLRPYLTNGQRLIDKVLTFKGQPRRQRRFFEYMALFRERQVSALWAPETQLEILRQMKPNVVRGYPSVLALISTHMRAREPLEFLPRLLFTDSELLTPTLRHSIETGFKRRVLDIYGTLETDNIAYECERHQGYHIALDAVVMEFVDKGRPVPPGDMGEIVCTVLGNWAMPFIRYRLNDFGILSARPCDCGRSFPLLKGLKGRTHDYAVTRDGKRLSSTFILSVMDRFANYINAFQIIQEDVDMLKTILIPGMDYHEGVADRIRSGLERLLPGAKVHIEHREHLNQEGSGKVMPFVSKVDTRTTLLRQRDDAS